MDVSDAMKIDEVDGADMSVSMKNSQEVDETVP